MSTQELALKVKQYGMYRSFVPSPDEVIVNEPQMESMFRFWTVGFRRYMPTQELLSYQWPRTWWDAVKERWYPKWAKSRWPVRYETVDLDQALDREIPRGLGDTFYVLTHDGIVVPEGRGVQ